MNNKELQAIRKMLMLDVKEAADFIGGVSARSWQRWETGQVAVPMDVRNSIMVSLEKRNQIIDHCDELFQEKNADEMDISYYLSFAEYRADYKDATIIDWRISQSVAAYYFADGFATLK